MLKHLASWSIAAVLLGLMAGEARPLQAVNAPPRKHPQDPHRFAMNGATWYPAGYYPGLGAFAPEVPDPNYVATLFNTLAANGINYMRNTFTMGQPYGNSPVPYRRTGPGLANDGRPKFDLNQFDQSYFDSFRNVVSYALSKGVVVQVCIIDGWHTHSLIVEDGGYQRVWGLQYDFYYGANNINGVSCNNDGEWLEPSGVPAQRHTALMKKLVDTIGDLPNIVWEIGNETGRTSWEVQYADMITSYEQSKGLATHLVMPRDLPGHQYVPYEGSNTDNNPVLTHDTLVQFFGQNLIGISDNDGAQDVDADTRRWKAWGCLTAGAHMSYFHFDMLQSAVVLGQDAGDGMRYLGYLRKFLADFGVNLIGMTPSDSRVSNGWCFARPGDEYIVYLHSGGSTTVNGLPSSYTARWFNPRDGSNRNAGNGPTFGAPDGNDWVLHVKSGGTTTPVRGPYGGSAWAIPGTIQAEDFDTGGEGVAFHDLDASNNGGQYRNEAVDIESCSEGGVSVGWMDAGEWLEYTVNVAAAGTYTLELRVASPYSGHTLHVEFGGVDKTGALTVPNTGDWMAWQTLTKAAVSLSAGTQILRVACDMGGYNLNYIRLTSASTGQTGNGTGLKGEYFDNMDFTALRVTRTDAMVNFSWVDGSPDPSIGPDTFSVRWTGQVQAPYSQTYTFYTVSDDGIRLWVNGQLIINNWSDHGDTENSGTISLSAGQKVDLKMEFYENGGWATAKLLWESASVPKQVIPQSQLYPAASGGGGGGLTGEYFDNMDFTALRVTRTDATVNFSWFDGSPDPAIGPDTFSVRWTGQVLAPYSQTYTFYTVSDDGVRLWVNGQLIINNWGDHADTENSGTIALSAGQRYDVRMEFYENGGWATAKLLWESPSIGKQVIPQSQLSPAAAASNGLTGEYYDNMDFTSLRVTRVDGTVNFDWAGGSPDGSIGPDTFSVRWTGKVRPQFSETYTFTTVSDDGVRLWVNGQLIVNNWSDHAPIENAGSITLSAGQSVDIRMEYYENGWGAVAKLLWSSPSTAKQVIPQNVLFSK